MPNVIKKYVRTGKVRVDTRVLKFIGPDSEKARKAMLAAAKQNKAYNFALVPLLRTRARRTPAGSPTAS